MSDAEVRLEDMFPPLYPKPFPTVERPACIVDAEGIILAWYLPRALTVSRQVNVLKRYSRYGH
jgi:hypothetical protein